MKKTLLTGSIGALVLSVVPIIASAQGTTGGFQGLITKLKDIIDNLIPLIIGLALLVFLWGILQYALAKDDGGKEAAKGYMLWGLVALFVMVSVWGLVNILQDTVFGSFNVNNAAPNVPKTPSL